MRLSPNRILLLSCLGLALIGLMIWPKQLIPGGAPSVVQAQTKGKQALDAARAALTQATTNEKLNPTKQTALAVDAALQQLRAATALRIAEIQVRLKELAESAEASGKNDPLLAEVAALEAELSELQPTAINGPTPTVTPETEPNNTSATANTINLSAASQPCGIVSAAINPGNDVDFFTFTGAPAGSRIWIETDTGGTQNAGANSRDTVIDLLAADGTTVIENDDDDGTGNGGDGTVETGLASMIGGRTLTTGGTYFIRVRAFSATGIVNPYRLFVVLTNVAATPEVEANNTAATANSLVTAGSPIGLRSGAIGAAGDSDYYSVAATAGNIVYFNVDADPERDGTGTDLVVEFRDPADVLLLSVDSSITGSLANPAAEGANFTITTSGTYFVRVRHFSATGTGTYHIMAGACSGDSIATPTPTVTPETEPNNTSGTANVIDLTSQPCAIVSAAINPGGDIDFFTFTGAPAGSRIWIETDTGGTQNAGATSRDTVIDLLAADGATVIENDDDDGTGNGGDGTVETGLASMIGGRTLTTGGTYFIRVRAFSATAIVNPYRLFVVLTNVAATPEVEPNNTAATANPIVTGSGQIGIRSGAITAGDSDYYSVAATAGNIVYFNVDADPERDGTGTDLVVEFRDPADVLLLSVDSSITGSLANPAAEGANFTITTSGTYFVRVRHFSATGTGTYHAMVSTCSGATGGGCTSITCPANVTQTNDPNQCGAVVTYPAPTANGTCGTITCSPASGSFFPVGTTTVTCTSSAGPTCSFTVTVTDDQPPSITCPANITVSNDPNQCGAVVNYPAPVITDNCPGSFTATCVPPSGSFFPVGTTTVTCTVNGFVAGPSGSNCTTITQSTSQAITPLNSVSCNNGIGHTDNSYWRAFSLPAFSITGAFDVQSIDVGIEDAISGGAAGQIVPPKGSQSTPKGSSPSKISHNIKVNAPAGGGQPVTVNLYTSSMAFPAGFPGSLTLIGTATTMVADQSGTILNIPVTGTAPAGSELVVEIFTPNGEAAGNLFFIGSNAAPETGPSYLSAPDCGVTTPTTTSAIGFPNMHIVLNVNGCQQITGGNGPTCTFTVTVNDTQPPVITCPPNLTAVTATVNDPCTVVNFTTTASDNCPGVVVVCTPPSGSCFPVGVTMVTCTATDASGNTATCSFTISVFNGRMQDDSEGCDNSVLFNTLTGDYRWCCHGTIYTGRGKVTKLGNTFTIEHNPADRRVLIHLSAGSFPPSGNASLQSPAGTIRCVIQDRDTRNDTCVCGAPVAPPSQ
jgi:HYR domain-containing protein/pre-peptidase